MHDLHVLALFKPTSCGPALLRSEPGFHDRLFSAVVDGDLDLSRRVKCATRRHRTLGRSPSRRLENVRRSPNATL